MMQQYRVIKKDHLDSILFFRMGDFYEMFNEDAKIASKILQITLTSRNKNQPNPVLMCGIPHHSSNLYITKLLKAGKKVAICEQTEDPLEAKKRGAKAVVNREVVRIITPGTLTEDDLLEQNLNNYLAAIYCSPKDCSLAWLDLSTGSFMVQTINLTNVSDVLSRIDPSEILIAETTLATCGLFLRK